MPLEKCRKGDRKCASRNIARERAAGKPRKQAIAIGLRSAGVKKRSGGASSKGSATRGKKRAASTKSTRKSSGGKLRGLL